MPIHPQPLEVAPAWHDRRGMLRRPIEAAVAIRQRDLGTVRVLLRDISQEGCRVTSRTPIVPGSFVILTLPTFAPFDTICAWWHDGEAGLRFSYPLHAAVLDHIVAANPPRADD